MINCTWIRELKYDWTEGRQEVCRLEEELDKDCHGKNCIQQEEDSFYQQIGLKFEEETNKMLHLEHGFVWC